MEIEELRRETRRLSDLLLERDFLFVDRFLTVRARAFPIADEAAAKIHERAATIKADADKEYQARESAYLQAKLKERIEDAEEAGLSIEQARRDFNAEEPLLIDQYRRELGFS